MGTRAGLLLVVLIAVGLFGGCDESTQGVPDDGTADPPGSGTPSENGRPTIVGLTAEPDTVDIEGVAVLTCNADDPDGDLLAYSWSCSAGSLHVTESRSDWIAPREEGEYGICCRVSDPEEPCAAETVWVSVRNLIPQKYLFEYSFERHSFGNQEAHYYIDRWGDVYRYVPDETHRIDWGECPEPYTPCLEEQYEQMYGSPEYVKTVDRDLLLSRYALIEPASTGEMTDQAVGCYDIGVRTFHALRVAPGDTLYQRVGVLGLGEVTWFNRSDEGKALFHYLNDIFCEGTDWSCMHPEWND